jgi:hypothetical protein
MDAKRVIDEALRLPADIRDSLAGELLASLDDSELEADREGAWSTEIRDRIDAYERGDVTAVPVDEGLAQIRAVRGKALEVLPAAIQEAVTATQWYLDRDERVAAAYEGELSRVFDKIERVPETSPHHHHGTDRLLLQRFPYEVVYEIYSDVLLIIAAAHCKRKPGYWRHR